MTIQEAISYLKADKEYLVDNKVCDGEEIDVAISIMEQQTNSCSTCKHGEATSGAWLYCLNHGCYLKTDNLCRDWEKEE